MIERLLLDKFLELADAAMQHQIAALLNSPGVNGIMCYEVKQIDSSQFGRRSFMTFGPDRTVKTLDEAMQHRLGDVPSRFAYPVAYYAKT